MNRWGMPGSGQSLAASSTSPSLSLSSTTTTSASGSTPRLVNNSDTNSSTGDLPSNSPTDSDNNNQPLSGKLNDPPQFLQPSPNEKSLTNLSNSTVSAAADSSDNQPPTPQPTDAPSALGNTGGAVEAVYSNNPIPYQPPPTQPILGQDMHHYPTYMHGYDQYYHPPPSNMDYATQSAIYAGQQQLPPGNQEYKIVPSPRYHPYMNNSGSLHPQHNTNGAASNNASSSASNSSLSPRVVSSSSPTQNAIMSQTGQDSMPTMQQEQGGGGGMPKVCDKCGAVFPSHAQLNEHYNAAHGTQPPNDRPAEDQQTLQSQYPYQPYIKEEPPSDILDLDSQKMVYPPQHDPSAIVNQDPLPPMHSMHPMHRSLMWGTAPDIHSGYMPHGQPPDMKPYYSPLKQNYAAIKSEYPGTVVPGFNAGPVIKSEFNSHPHQTAAPQSREIKPFNAEINSGGGNPVTSSPSEFPSTTTPQENGAQYRGFEPPTSSLPSNTTGTKSSTWKSNEARRPKTYNCTACNKWFTSSGHLKRHYNTTLHKNAVKSSGQPDPATLPISAHHHPSRDPNSKHHHRNSQGNQPPPAPPEPPRSPDYASQYTPPPNSYSQQQGFQQYTNVQQSAPTNGHPNGQAGPSDHASLQQRGLLIISSTPVTSNLEAQQDQEQMHHLLHQQQQQVEVQDPYTSLQQVQQQQEVLQAEEADPEGLHQQVINTNTLDPLQPQQQSQEVHIISMSPQIQQHMLPQQLQEEPIISTMGTTPTTTTIINTMDQQFIITSPLAINTNITPSFQPLQHQEEPQLNYHTITGNEVTEGQLMNANDMPEQLYELANYGIDDEQQQHEIVAVQRLPSGMVNYQDNMPLPYTPIVPDSCFYSSNIKCERSPEVGDVAPEISPYSPTITSTKATLPSPPAMECREIKRSSPSALRRRKQDKAMQDPSTPLGFTSVTGNNLITLSIDIPATQTPNSSLGTPTGEIRCDECNKQSHLENWTCRKRMHECRA
ncbi:unnamed protein product [Hermetia illucens]|uniref:C2H2-type domain-containing protein n=1 Tax=Hermetia illucens TaxID=343691 RepID=A0A7R8UVW9_HERIL|nr:unnamed protein product [Hermetia illucens]